MDSSPLRVKKRKHYKLDLLEIIVYVVPSIKDHKHVRVWQITETKDSIYGKLSLLLTDIKTLKKNNVSPRNSVTIIQFDDE